MPPPPHTHTPGNAVGACLFIVIILEAELKTFYMLSDGSTLRALNVRMTPTSDIMLTSFIPSVRTLDESEIKDFT